MKKTIASLAILMSSSASMALPMPRDPNEPVPQPKTVCLRTYELQDGSKIGSCDAAALNAGKKLQANGCAKGQVAITSYGEIAISACMPPGMAQL